MDVVWMLYGCCMKLYVTNLNVCNNAQRSQGRPQETLAARGGWPMVAWDLAFLAARPLAARDGGMGCSFPCHAGWLATRNRGVGFGIPCRAGSLAARNGGVGFDLGWAGLGRAGLGWLALAWPGPRQWTDRDPTASQNVTERLAGTRKRTQRAGRKHQACVKIPWASDVR